MANFLNRVLLFLQTALARLRAAVHPSQPWVARTRELGRSRRLRKIGIIVVSVVLFLGLATYIAVPPILRHVLTGPVAASIHRDVSVGKIRFNLYRLKLDLDQLHVAERGDPQKPFVDLGHLAVKVSWSSLWRLAPVVGEVVVDKPNIHIVRKSQQEFNFSDLLESTPAPAQPTAAPTERAEEIRRLEHPAPRRRNNHRRPTVRQAAQGREHSDQRAVHREPAVGRGRLRATAAADGD